MRHRVDQANLGSHHHRARSVGDRSLHIRAELSPSWTTDQQNCSEHKNRRFYKESRLHLLPPLFYVPTRHFERAPQRNLTVNVCSLWITYILGASRVSRFF